MKLVERIKVLLDYNKLQKNGGVLYNKRYNGEDC